MVLLRNWSVPGVSWKASGIGGGIEHRTVPNNEVGVVEGFPHLEAELQPHVFSARQVYVSEKTKVPDIDPGREEGAPAHVGLCARSSSDVLCPRILSDISNHVRPAAGRGGTTLH